MTKYYQTLNTDLKKHFSKNIFKIALNTGFSCPTRDGTHSTKGCFYCGETGSHYQETQNAPTIKEQIEKGKIGLKIRYKSEKFIAYFQAFTSTYAPIEILEQKLLEVTNDPDILGINLSTRPDCVDNEKLDLIAKILTPKYHWFELGLESGHNKILKSVNRGHTYEDFEKAFYAAKKRNLRICAHLILGLPGETEKMMLETIKKLINLGISGLKFHNLHIVKNSVFENYYEKGTISLYELNEYANLITKIMLLIPENVIIHRFFGDAPPKLLIAPKWVLQKQKALLHIKKQLKDQKIEELILKKH